MPPAFSQALRTEPGSPDAVGRVCVWGVAKFGVLVKGDFSRGG